MLKTTTYGLKTITLSNLEQTAFGFKKSNIRMTSLDTEPTTTYILESDRHPGLSLQGGMSQDPFQDPESESRVTAFFWSELWEQNIMQSIGK